MPAERRACSQQRADRLCERQEDKAWYGTLLWNVFQGTAQCECPTWDNGRPEGRTMPRFTVLTLARHSSALADQGEDWLPRERVTGAGKPASRPLRGHTERNAQLLPPETEAESVPRCHALEEV